MIKKRKQISFGRGLTSIEGLNWEFNNNIAKSFDKHVRQSIPLYDEIQKYICSISEWFIKQDSVVYDLGCSTGETAKNIYLYNQNKKFNYIGIDQNSKMISYAKLKIHSNKVKFKCLNINKITTFKKSDLFISILLFPFLTITERKKLLKKIYSSLHPGGALIFIDKINSTQSIFQDMFNQIYFDFKIEKKLTSTQILNKSKSLRGSLKTFEEKELISFCKESGFNKIDNFFRWYNFVGIIAIK